jgi:putative methyltransferase (TIGR04325 family)
MHKNKTAPVIVFAFRRPAHLARTLAALALNKEASSTDVIIYCDYLPSGADSDALAKMNLTRDIARRESRFQSVRVVERSFNLGLAENVIQGVTEVINSHGYAIVLEDDLLVSTGFLAFMNEALLRYRDNEQVACISGYVYPLSKTPSTAFFLLGADCWGWATWASRWEILQKNPDVLIESIYSRKLQSVLDFDGSYPYMRMLVDRSKRLNDSWAILWYASALVKEKLCLYPPRSYVENIGNDGSGTNHLNWSSIYKSSLASNEQMAWPENIVESSEGRKLFVQFFGGMKPSLLLRVRRVLGKVKRIFINHGVNNNWSGDYHSWQEAESNCTGYDNTAILDQVEKAVRKVMRGEAAFERDGVAFKTLVYSSHLHRVLNEVYEMKGKPISVLDFGGSLGSLYFQYKDILHAKIESWNVVEQSHFVLSGQSEFSNDKLKFFLCMDDVVNEKQPDVLILSSVICYLQNPYDWIKKFIETGIEHVIIDRTGFIQGNKDRLTIQRVPAAIYSASYPAWFLNEEKFLMAWLRDYDVCQEIPSMIEGPSKVDELTGYHKGFHLRKKK